VADRAYSLKWNEAAGQWFARFRQADGQGGWGTKRLPKAIKRHQALDAERWMITWYAEYQRTGGLSAPASQIVPARKTIFLLADRWIEYRRRDEGTALSTFNGYGQALRNWILTNDRFVHYPVDQLDMEIDFTAEVCLAWLDSLQGKETSQLRHAEVLRQMFRDCIAHGWLNADMFNPFDRPVVARRLAQLRRTSDEDRATAFFTAEQVEVLLTRPNSKVIDYRRVKYVLVLATGLRDGEVQGLIWSDFLLDDALPYVFVDRQLVRPGPKPFVTMKELRHRGVGKTELAGVEQAVMSEPKKKSRRALPLVPLAVETLRYWWKHGWRKYTGVAPAKDDPVFPAGQRNSHREYGEFCSSCAAELLRADLDRVGLPKEFIDTRTKAVVPFNFHHLRHTFATLLEAGGVERSRIGELLGHKANDVASKHYIGNALASRLPLVSRLPLPNRVQLLGKLIEVRGANANVVPLRSKKSEAAGR
jgi:integrase